MLVGIIVLHGDQWASRGHVDPQLFFELTAQGSADRLASFNLAAGKLPQAALMLCISTTGNQDSAVAASNDGRSHMNAFHP